MNWYYYKKALMPDTEIHNEFFVSKKEIKSLLQRNKALFLRYTSNFDQKTVSSAYYVIKDTWDGLEELSSNTRNQVRKALKKCEVKRIEKEVLLTQGYLVYKSHSNKDQTIRTNISHSDYIKMVQQMTDRELWGCFDIESNTLIAYSQNMVGEGVQYVLAKANPDFYKTHYPYYALFYKMNEFYLSECKKKYVSDGFRTLDNHSNIQNFLIEKFKFRKAYCKLHIHYIWYLNIVVKLIFPFRKSIKQNQIKNLLIQEEISRESLK